MTKEKGDYVPEKQLIDEEAERREAELKQEEDESTRNITADRLILCIRNLGPKGKQKLVDMVRAQGEETYLLLKRFVREGEERMMRHDEKTLLDALGRSEAIKAFVREHQPITEEKPIQGGRRVPRKPFLDGFDD